LGVTLLVAGVAMPRAARAHVPNHVVSIPETLQSGDQHFDATVAGIRAYLETIKSSDPSLYGQLAPDVARLESMRDGARTALAGGILVGLGAVIYGIASRDDCRQPPLTDPNFAADSMAWGDCTDHNISRIATFSFVGVGAFVVGGLIAYASAPTRQDLLDVVNKNNRLSKQPLQLQIGYDPTQRFAFSGATVSF
jgi:hypothetical protein